MIMEIKYFDLLNLSFLPNQNIFRPGRVDGFAARFDADVFYSRFEFNRPRNGDDF